MLGLSLSLSLGAQYAAGGDTPPLNKPANTVAPTLTDAQADGEIQTLDYGTWTDANTISIAYMVDGATVQTYALAYGDAAPTRTYDYATEGGKLRQIVVTATNTASDLSATVSSDVRVGPTQATVYQQDWSGYSNTELRNVPGWSVVGNYSAHFPRLVAKDGNVVAIDSCSNAANATWRYAAGGSNAKFRAVVRYDAGTDTTGSTRGLMVLFGDSNNCALISVALNSCVIYKRIGGAQTTVFSQVNMTNVDGTEWEAEPVVIGGNRLIRVWRRLPGESDFTLIATSSSAGTDPFNDAVFDAAYVALIGATKNGAMVYPINVWGDVAITTPASDSIVVNVTDGIVSPSDPAKQRITISGGYRRGGFGPLGSRTDA